MNTLDLPLEVKEVSEAGAFLGLASAYGNVDLQGDIVERGAFTATIKRRPKIPILWQHHTDQPIGLGKLEDSDSGLLVKGQLVLDVAKAREAYALLKTGAIKGLSIGYSVRDHEWRRGNRVLKEVDLMEVSLVTMPANPRAEVLAVKEWEAAEMDRLGLLLAQMRVFTLERKLRGRW